MNRVVTFVLGTMLIWCGVFVPPGKAENAVLKRQCEDKAGKAAELIRELGAAAAFEKITAPEGPFIDGNSHVFCIDSENAVLLAHKVSRFVGVNMHNYKDADNNSPYTDILDRAKKQKSGWTSYLTYGSGPDKRQTPGLKNMYFLKVPGQSIVLCCGYWEDHGSKEGAP